MNSWKNFPVSLIDYEFPLIRVSGTAKLTKERDIQIMEWAICAPLFVHPEDPPDLNEIAQELGIELVDFLMITVEELVTLGVLQPKGDFVFELTNDIGRKVFQKKKMISRPREVQFIIFKDPISGEWLPSILEVSKIQDEDLISPTSTEAPQHVADSIILQHFSLRKSIMKEGEVLTTSIVDETFLFRTTTKIQILLTNEGLKLGVVDKNYDAVTKQRLLQGFNQTLLEEEQLRHYLPKSPFSDFNLPAFQPHQFDSSNIFALTDKLGKQIEQILKSARTWVIDTLSDKARDTTIYPNNIEVIFKSYENQKSGIISSIPNQDNPLMDRLIVRIPVSNRHPIVLQSASHSLIPIKLKVDLFAIPLLIQGEKENLPSNLNQVVMWEPKDILEEFSFEDSRDKALLDFYLAPTLNNLDFFLEYALLENNFSDQNSTELIRLITPFLNFIPSQNDSKPSQLNQLSKIIYELTLDDLRNFFDSWKLFLPDFFVSAVELRFSERIEALESELGDLSVIESIERITAIQTELISFAELLKDFSEGDGLVPTFSSQLHSIIDSLPLLLTPQSGIELYNSLFNLLDKQKYERGKEGLLEKLRENLLKNIKADNLNLAEELFRLAQIHKVSFSSSEEKTLAPLVERSIPDLDLLQKSSMKNFLDFFSKNRSLLDSSLVEENVTSSLEYLHSGSDYTRKQLQNIINNLKDLSKVNMSVFKSIVPSFLKNWIVMSEPTTGDEFQTWLYLLTRVQSSIERPLKVEAIPWKGDELWNKIRDVLDKFPSLESKALKPSLGQLNLKIQYQDYLKAKTNSSTEPSTTTAQDSTNYIPTDKLDSIIVDGNNVAYYRKLNGNPDITLLNLLYSNLTSDYNFQNVFIYISAALRRKVASLEPVQHLIDRNILHIAPAGASDDFQAIQAALDQNAYILTNDQFKDWAIRYPNLKEEIQKRRITFMLNPSGERFILGEFPEFNSPN